MKPRLVKCFLLWGLLGLSTAAISAGPTTVAQFDYRLWPEAINNPAGFDKASRAALLVYAPVLEKLSKASDAELLAKFHIKSLSRASINDWMTQQLAMLGRNYQLAATDCQASDWTCAVVGVKPENFVAQARLITAKIPVALTAWQQQLSGFAGDYASEQMRLAALFPKVNSEVSVINAQEFNGDELADRLFYLSFDDGPSAPKSTTDELITMLTAQQKSAVFFVLGENFSSRLKKNSKDELAKLYGQQCVAIHGYQHQSHAKWADWQQSIQRTQVLIASTLADKQTVALFRPPYGQRKVDSGAFFQRQGLRVALWNLDSQDWNQKISSDAIIGRMVALMLIKTSWYCVISRYSR
ncbi:polysaccharide deacetylase family protein [Methylocucumis oryzae]|uniref:polysaccharide deacetylase family protein n=1 Tax=Methylocucumis oryzae TaxID=1632867 RepID=UPI000696392A|nr:polysaccharide deacetylase family protein [Methylocucumis oryzae]